jgi:hypothetical protein
MNPGLFRNVIGPWARRTGRAAMQWAEGAGGKGFATIKSNAGIGWSALKSNPKGAMGISTLRQAGMGFRAGARGFYRGDMIRGEMGLRMGFGSLGKWAAGGGYTGAGRIGVGAARTGAALGAADFLNPWGLGWGD